MQSSTWAWRARFLSLLLILLPHVALSDEPPIFSPGPSCYRRCRYTLCSITSNFTRLPSPHHVALRDYNIASTPVLCSRSLTDPQLQTVHRIGETFYATPGRRSLPRKAFKKASALGLPSLDVGDVIFPTMGNLSGVKSTSRKKMKGLLHDKCVLLPLREFDVRMPTSGRVRRVRSNSPQNCVSFRANEHELLIELSWNSADDLDVSLEEPGGALIDYANKRSVRGGGLLGDSPVGDDICNYGRNQEVIVYPFGARLQRGTYRVNVTHFENCNCNCATCGVCSTVVKAPTVFHLAVIRRGVWIMGVDNMESKKDRKEVVYSAKFTI